MFSTAPSGGCKQIMKSIGRAPKCGRVSVNLVGGSTQSNPREFIVLLIAYYVVFMIAGDLAAYASGWVTEFEFGGQVSLIVTPIRVPMARLGACGVDDAAATRRTGEPRIGVTISRRAQSRARTLRRRSDGCRR